MFIEKIKRILDTIITAAAVTLRWNFCPIKAGVEPQIGILTEVTAYCSCRLCCNNYSGDVAASGHRIKVSGRFIAADPKIPFGTEFIVQGYNDDRPVLVLDRDITVKGNHIKVYFDTHDQALEWGRKWLPVIRLKTKAEKN